MPLWAAVSADPVSCQNEDESLVTDKVDICDHLAYCIDTVGNYQCEFTCDPALFSDRVSPDLRVHLFQCHRPGRTRFCTTEDNARHVFRGPRRHRGQVTLNALYPTEADAAAALACSSSVGHPRRP
eukprot:57854-Rhodomonas_salina.4